MTNAQRVARRSGPGFFYPPDPSSQIVCSIGGNVAENSGGAHCFKYGFTTNYVTGLELVLADGEMVQIGGYELDPPGYDLLGAFVGSEGTLGVATKIWLRDRPLARGGQDAGRVLRHHARGRRGGVGDRPGRRRPGRDRDDGRAGDRGVRADAPTRASRCAALRCWSSSTARERECEARFDEVVAICERNGSDDVRVARDEAERQRVLEDAQGRVRGDGPDLAQLLRPGRRDPAHQAAGGARADRRARPRVRA